VTRTKRTLSTTIAIPFTEAVRRHVTDLRAELRVHPSFEELEAYGHDSLPNGRRDELAEHLAICENCGALLRYGVLYKSRPEGRAANEITRAGVVDLNEEWEALSRHLDRRSPEWLSLSSSLPEGRPSLEVVLSVGRSVAEALAALHDSGGLVRDLRTETVQVDPERGHVRFLDLGIATAPECLEGNGRSAQELMADAVRGTSPEQVGGERLDHRSNLFSLGSLLYEIATGVAPFRGPTPLDTAGRVLALEALPARQVREDLPTALETLLQRLLNKEPNERPASAAAVAAALEAMENGVANPLDALRETDDLDAEIETLYRRIDTLTQARKAGGDPETEGEIASAFAQLKELQKAEAARFREEFEARLAMPVDAGATILSRARSLRKRLERLTTRDPSSD
jgi:hypothetical protein